ncbi:MAG: endonuclease domain-containing protein [Oscillospiraceae bacterium]|nr:endonuclease domain-containing protein [Oscillospiraceae bacterium]MDY3258308.1 endonuclease domain-containing protein [Ruminococcus callidus]
MEKDYKYTGYNSYLKDSARILRKNMTRHERHLWYDFLKNYPVKWYRQRVIDKYIADFYCSKANLVIELDGSQHFTEEGIEYDSVRNEIMEQYNLKIIHISNVDIDRNFYEVCEIINNEVEKCQN